MLQLEYGLAGTFLVADFTPWFTADLHTQTGSVYWPEAGPLFYVYLVWFAGCVIFATYLVPRAYK